MASRRKARTRSRWRPSKRIQAALGALDASLADVVRTRMYVVDVERHQFDVGRAHNEFFADVRPTSTMVGIAGLVGPEFLVEIEVDAIVASERLGDRLARLAALPCRIRLGAQDAALSRR